MIQPRPGSCSMIPEFECRTVRADSLAVKRTRDACAKPPKDDGASCHTRHCWLHAWQSGLHSRRDPMYRSGRGALAEAPRSRRFRVRPSFSVLMAAARSVWYGPCTLLSRSAFLVCADEATAIDADTTLAAAVERSVAAFQIP